MADVHRYRVTIEYDGTNFVGWQRQPNNLAVQEVLETAIFAFSGEQVTTQAAGRTDSGVHALGQVAHFDLSKEWDPYRILQALNYHTKPHPVTVLDCEAVGLDFEARFTATKRHYKYRISNRRGRPALDYKRVWHVPKPLDAPAMHDAAQMLLGVHDFTTFRAAECQAQSPIRSVDKIGVKRIQDDVEIYVSARSFLHNMVRSFVGSLKMVGEGKWDANDLKAALEAKDRQRCGAMAPACGLYLTHVDYDPNDQLPPNSAQRLADYAAAEGSKED